MTEEQLGEHARLYPHLQPPPRFPVTVPLLRVGEWFAQIDDWLDLQQAHWAPLFKQHFPNEPPPPLASVGARGRQAELTWALRIDRLALLEPIEQRLREQWLAVGYILHVVGEEESKPMLILRLTMLQQFFFLFESFINPGDQSLARLMAAVASPLGVP